MKAGARWLTAAAIAGVLSALVVSGCGNSDYPPGPEWTSATPAFTTVDTDTGEVRPGVTGALPHETLVRVDSATTVATTIPTTASLELPVVDTETGAPADGGESIDDPPRAFPWVTATTSIAGEEQADDPPSVIPDQNWAHPKVPKIDSPPVEDPERIRYAQEQLQTAYFKWFDAIYRKDPAALWDAVVTENTHQAGVRAMERMTFTAPPTLEGVKVEVLELHIDHPDCLAASFEADISAFRSTRGPVRGMEILWSDPHYGWRSYAFWGLPVLHGIGWSSCFMLERLASP